MEWLAVTKKKAFEAKRQRDLIKSIVEDAIGNHEEPAEIKSISIILKDNRETEICEKGLDIFSKKVEEAFSRELISVEDERLGQEEIQKDYWANLL